MKSRIISNPARVWHFVNGVEPIDMCSGMKGIGLEVDGEVEAGVLFERYTGTDMWLHMAARETVAHRGRCVLDFVHSVFHYAFVQAGCNRVTGPIRETNARARKMAEHLGFVPEAFLKGASRDGSDLVLYVMWKTECKYVQMA
jgi:RimJ/RimL family protein N-acetyltransferase